VRLDFAQALQAHTSFDTSQSYVVYCEIGLKSAHLVEVMRRRGLDAHRFRGDLRALRRQAELR
jgi:rhodanese-related sulfurtransferase